MVMKESGIEWVGLIPDDWKIAKNNRLFNISKQLVNENWKNTQLLSLTKSGIIEKNINDGGGKQPESFGTYQYVEKDDIVLCLFDIDVSAVFSDRSKYDGMISPAYRVMKCTDAILPVYAKWWFDAVNIGRYYLIYTKSLRKTIDADGFGNILTVVPPLSEQQAIADYLDETCSKIDEIIAEANASVKEYKELKQSVIFDGISLGTRSCCEYKKTTLEGIKKIPVAWEYRKLKFLIKYIESGVSVNAGNEPATELEYGVLKTSCVSKMVFIPSENKSVNKDEYARVKCHVCGNTIIVSRMNTPDLVGACAYIEKNINNLFLPDRLWQVHFNDDVNVKYVYYCLISPYIRNYYSSLSTGTSSSMQNISQGQFANAIITYPSLEEQKEIVEFLDKRTAEIDSLIAEKESLINDLEAYKKSLIYEVVTGKRRVV